MTDKEKRVREQRKREQERDRQFQRERLELLKNKAGVAENRAPAAVAEPKKHYTISQKIESFVYLYKTYIILFGIFAFIVIYLIVNLLSIVKPDVKIGVISDDGNFANLTENIEAALTPYCEDFNGDGKVSVSVLYFSGPVDVESGEAVDQSDTANVIKLSNELQKNETIMLIIDNEMIDRMEMGSGVFANGKELFPGDKNAVEYGYALSGTDFAQAIGYDEMSDDLIAAFRKPIDGLGDIDIFKENFDNTLIMWDNYLTDNKLS
jgi:hypothetical protein